MPCRMKKYLLSTLLVLCFACCTPFDSNNLNKRMIQGRWEQVNIIPLDNDSISTDDSALSTMILDFRGDSCFETFSDADSNRHFGFMISSYVIRLEEANRPTSHLVIAKLTDDSLVFRTDSKILKYKKIDSHQ